MSRGLLDTSVFIAGESGRPLDSDAIPNEVAVSVVTVGELWAGVLAAADTETRNRRLGTLTAAMELEPLPIDGRVAEAWANLRATLRQRGKRMPVNDSWIAATAMALRASVVTQDADYPDIPGLDVVRI